MLVAAATLAAFLSPEFGSQTGVVVMLVGYSVAGASFIWSSRRYEGKEATAWHLIGIGLLVGAAGILALIVATVSGLEPPAFGPLDLFFLAAYTFTLAGFWVLPHLEGPAFHRARILLDGMVGAVSVAVVAWVWLLDDMASLAIRSTSPWEVVIASVYPIFDVAVLVAVMLVTLRRSTYRFDPRMLLFGLGASAQAVADLTFFHRGLGSSFAETDPVYSAYLLATTAFLFAGLMLHREPEPREYAERNTPWWAIMAPYGAAVALLGMLVVEVIGADFRAETMKLFVGVMVVMGLIVVRQAVAIRENRELVERQRSALVSSISHELRTPLTAMVGFLDILTDPDQHMDTQARSEVLDIVDQQATYMARIVSDLVMLNRKEPDLQLQQRLVPVESVARAAIDSVEVETASGAVVEIESGLMGFFDPDRMQQVLVNLLTNAARYGGPRRLVTASATGNDLVLEVHDDGPGVAKRYELTIWDRFERGAHRYDAGIPGSGIGLAIVDMLVRAHNGTAVYRRSEHLGGSCFAVTLPGRAQSRVERVVPDTRMPVAQKE